MDAQADTTSSLANHRTALQSVINTFNGVVLHADEEARAKLSIWCAGVEQGWGRMGKVSLRHQVIRLENAFDVFAMDTNSDTHNHVLWALGNTPVYSEKI